MEGGVCLCLWGVVVYSVYSITLIVVITGSEWRVGILCPCSYRGRQRVRGGRVPPHVEARRAGGGGRAGRSRRAPAAEYHAPPSRSDRHLQKHQPLLLDKTLYVIHMLLVQDL